MIVAPVLGGLLAGLLAGTFGVGGGAITIPILVFILGLETKIAIATNLFIVFVTSLSSLIFHSAQGTVKKKGVIMGIAGTVGTLIGNAVFFGLSQDQLDKILGLVFLTISVLVFFRGNGKREAEVKHLILVGLFMGIYSGVVGKGGGSLAVPLLMVLFKVEIKDAIGSSVAATPIVSFASMLPKALAGLVSWATALLFVPGMIVGTYLGSRFMKRSKSESLRKIYSALMAVIGLKFLGVW